MVNRIPVLVRRLWIPNTFLQHIIEVTRMNIVARLLGFGVVRGDTRRGRDTPPVEVPDSVTITCPYQEKPRALNFLHSVLFACLLLRIHVDHRFSKFSNRVVTIFDIQIVINGLDTQVYFWSASLILAFSLLFSFLVMCCAVYDQFAVCRGCIVYFVYR